MVTNSCQGNTYDVKNLAPGTDYMFRVRTENVYGKSKPSAPSEVIRTLSENRWMTAREDKEADDRGVRLTRRHSHYIKVENSVSNLLQKTDKEEEMSEVGTIPFKRNSSIRHSLPVQCVRRTSPLPSSILPGSRRESVCSLKDRESRKSIEESSVFTTCYLTLNFHGNVYNTYGERLYYIITYSYGKRSSSTGEVGTYSGTTNRDTGLSENEQTKRDVEASDNIQKRLEVPESKYAEILKDLGGQKRAERAFQKAAYGKVSKNSAVKKEAKETKEQA